MFLSSELRERSDDHAPDGERPDALVVDPISRTSADRKGECADIERILRRLAFQRTGGSDFALAFEPNELRRLRRFLAFAGHAQGRVVRLQPHRTTPKPAQAASLPRWTDPA